MTEVLYLSTLPYLQVTYQFGSILLRGLEVAIQLNTDALDPSISTFTIYNLPRPLIYTT